MSNSNFSVEVPFGVTRVLTAFLFLSAQSLSAAHSNPLDESRQCLVVIVSDWKSYVGELHAFERSEGEAEWRSHGNAVPVVLGFNGLAWGRGFMKSLRMVGGRKREGDNKTPAGVFRLGAAFGYAPEDEARWIKMPYIGLTHATEGVDDPRSKYYNRIVDRTKIDNPDWTSYERLMRDDDVYRWGVVIEHNSDPVVAGAGSCIYLHVWRASTHPTSGCIAMAQSKLISLLEWLDPEKKPFLVAAPERIYSTRFPRAWNLPELEPTPDPATSGRGR